MAHDDTIAVVICINGQLLYYCQRIRADVITMSRPKNNEKYCGFDFPESHRVYEIEYGDFDVLDFVKLTLI